MCWHRNITCLARRCSEGPKIVGSQIEPEKETRFPNLMLKENKDMRKQKGTFMGWSFGVVTKSRAAARMSHPRLIVDCGLEVRSPVALGDGRELMERSPGPPHKKRLPDLVGPEGAVRSLHRSGISWPLLVNCHFTAGPRGWCSHQLDSNVLEFRH